MDPVAIAFYALVCSGLSAASPAMPRLAVRLAVGAGVGMAASLALPVVRGLIGG
ncbi:hypothetical protein [Psychromarinibacter halotolerans]|mgnify:FL=1|uniref:Uncharacterized protein n=1 Tax=Psychromarinibacter halotolerans TaxID=1775175 RepID=A0ABV7GK99_9RHOB|nr:hypothetical protein [Psychromarinibacter halotolerans]MDF0595548.1 hypothetical protein [Psychromarinibacter halotolerans]